MAVIVVVVVFCVVINSIIAHEIIHMVPWFKSHNSNLHICRHLFLMKDGLIREEDLHRVLQAYVSYFAWI